MRQNLLIMSNKRDQNHFFHSRSRKQAKVHDNMVGQVLAVKIFFDYISVFL